MICDARSIFPDCLDVDLHAKNLNLVDILREPIPNPLVPAGIKIPRFEGGLHDGGCQFLKALDAAERDADGMEPVGSFRDPLGEVGDRALADPILSLDEHSRRLAVGDLCDPSVDDLA